MKTSWESVVWVEPLLKLVLGTKEFSHFAYWPRKKSMPMKCCLLKENTETKTKLSVAHSSLQQKTILQAVTPNISSNVQVNHRNKYSTHTDKSNKTSILNLFKNSKTFGFFLEHQIVFNTTVTLRSCCAVITINNMSWRGSGPVILVYSMSVILMWTNKEAGGILVPSLDNKWIWR